MPATASDVSELKQLVKQLQASANNNPPTIIDILQNLKKNFVVSEALLRDSKAGLAVGKLRTHADKGVSDAAKELVAKWKAEVAKAKEPVRKASISSSTAPPTPTTPTATSVQQQQSLRNSKKDGVTFNATGDRTRDRCTELVYDSLAMDSSAPSDKIKSIAIQIEQATFRQHKHQLSAEYKTRMRQLFSNLKDKGNPSLRARVVSGEIKVAQLAEMTTQDMASQERKEENARIAHANMFASLGAGEQQAETDAFQCGRCKQRKTRYRQAQTRSADEPMTTFVTCVNCGNKWKFS